MEAEPEKNWVCTFCTYKNRTRKAPTTCEVCSNKRVFAANARPPPPRPPTHQGPRRPIQPVYDSDNPGLFEPITLQHFSPSNSLQSSHLNQAPNSPHSRLELHPPVSPLSSPHNSSPSLRHHSSSRDDRRDDREKERSERHRERDHDRDREKELHRESSSSSRYHPSPAPSLVSSAPIPRHPSLSREPTNEREKEKERPEREKKVRRESREPFVSQPQLPHLPPDFVPVSPSASFSGFNSSFAPSQPSRRDSNSISVRKPHLTKEEKEKAREDHKLQHQQRMEQRHEEKKARTNEKLNRSAFREPPVLTDKEKSQRSARQQEMRAKLHSQVKLMQEQEQQRFEQAQQQRANPVRPTYADKIEELKRLREERKRDALARLDRSRLVDATLQRSAPELKWKPYNSGQRAGDEMPNVSGDTSGMLESCNAEMKPLPPLPGLERKMNGHDGKPNNFHVNNNSNSNIVSIFDLPSNNNPRNNSNSSSHNSSLKTTSESLRTLHSPSGSNSNASSQGDLARSNPGSDPVIMKESQNRVHVFVYNLPLPVDTQTIHEYFGGATIKNIDFKTNIYDEYLGSCVIEYYEAAAAQDALCLDGEFLGDSELIVVEEDLENEDLTVSQNLEKMQCAKFGAALLEAKTEAPNGKKALPETLVAIVADSSSSDNAAPTYPLSFACPITNELMSDPVIVIESRMVYERTAIEQWFSKSSTDPMTNVELKSKTFIPVLAFKEAIEEWKEMHNYRED